MNTYMKLFVVFLFFGSPAYANDSVGYLSAGGLELQKTDNIEMVSEALEISTKKIKVEYHFLNTSEKDIKTTVAFPMPPRVVNPDADEDNRVLVLADSFHTFTDGKLVSFHKHQVYLINDVDVTDQLRKIGLSDKQIFDQDIRCIEFNDKKTCKLTNLTNKQIAALKKMLRHDATKKWTLAIQDIPYWEQVFPAGREIEVIHEYKPFVGMMMGANMNQRGKDDRACLDERTRRAISKRLMGNSEGGVGSFFTYTVSYILGTGRNWKGPIKDFKLILRKGAPDVIVSLCFPGTSVTTSPTTIEFTHKDFVPQDQLDVFFYDIRH